jgi:hypothetical protein
MRLVQGKARALVGKYYGTPGAAYEVQTPTAVASSIDAIIVDLPVPVCPIAYKCRNRSSGSMPNVSRGNRRLLLLGVMAGLRTFGQVSQSDRRVSRSTAGSLCHRQITGWTSATTGHPFTLQS